MTILREKAIKGNYYINFIAILPMYRAINPRPKLHNG
jgi:hypothetical protein